MVFGAIITAFGYAIFYWGYHLFTPNRYSLWQVLGLDKIGKLSISEQLGPIGLYPNVQVKPATKQSDTQPQQGSNQTTPSPLNPTGGSWQVDILAGVGAPQSASNIKKMSAWNQCEGNAAGRSGVPINNPFNTTLSCCGGTSVNSAGVKAYPTWAAGLQATTSTLQSGFYVRIVNNLRNDGSFSDFASAVGSSPWGTSGSCIASVLGA